MSNDNVLIFAESVDFGRFVEIHMAIQHVDDTISVFGPSAPTKMPESDANMVRHAPMLSLSMRNAQKFIDALWSVGLRPTQSLQSAGAAEATEKHLNDMRAMVSKLAKVELPK